MVLTPETLKIDHVNCENKEPVELHLNIYIATYCVFLLTFVNQNDEFKIFLSVTFLAKFKKLLNPPSTLSWAPNESTAYTKTKEVFASLNFPWHGIVRKESNKNYKHKFIVFYV